MGGCWLFFEINVSIQIRVRFSYILFLKLFFLQISGRDDKSLPTGYSWGGADVLDKRRDNPSLSHSDKFASNQQRCNSLETADC